MLVVHIQILTIAEELSRAIKNIFYLFVLILKLPAKVRSNIEHNGNNNMIIFILICILVAICVNSFTKGDY